MTRLLAIVVIILAAIRIGYLLNKIKKGNK